MPGIAFLFKKRFHPARIDQQKKLYIAEQKVLDRDRQELERSEEVAKELEVANYEHSEQRRGDPRHSDLKFMYAMPIKDKDKGKRESAPSTPYVDGEDDEMVKLFRQRLKNAESGEFSTAAVEELNVSAQESTNVAEDDDGDAGDSKKAKVSARKNNPNFGASSHQSALEKAVGKRQRTGYTQEEQAQHFSFLRNAPTEGIYTQNVQVRHKPFNEVVRNVHCVRCGGWGHQSGDRECPLRDNNPHDFARLKREDPLTYIKSDEFLREKQKLILRTADAAGDYGAGDAGSSRDATRSNVDSQASAAAWNPAPSSYRSGAGSSSSSNKRLASSLMEDEAEEVSDPEADFIATLTPREKTLLLRKLQMLESGNISSVISDSSSSSDSSSDSSTESSSDSGSGNRGGGHQLPKSKSNRKSSRKEKKSKHGKSKKSSKSKHKKRS